MKKEEIQGSEWKSEVNASNQLGGGIRKVDKTKARREQLNK